jgi:hypothetical protein
MKKRFYGWAAACAVSLTLLVSGMNAFAARTGTVRINDVNIRTEASAESARVCTLPINTEVTIADQANDSDGNVWYSITFSLDGADKAGWIRSDLLTVSETEETEGEETTAQISVSDYTMIEPEESYPESDSLTQTSLPNGEESVTAWQVSTELTGGSELYLVYASRSDGSTGWYYYDPQEETFQRDMGQFSSSTEEEPEGLIEALQNELAQQKELAAASLKQRMQIIIGLIVLSVVLLVLLIVFIIKYRNAAYEYYDEEEENGEENFDDFLEAVKEKRADVDDDDEEEGAEETDNEPDLPEIDLSVIAEVEEEAEAADVEDNDGEAVAEEADSEEAEADDDLEGFDIEIFDLDDLNL